jgi:hypothetical protein
VCDKA